MEIASFVIACVSALAASLAVWYARAQKRVAERAAVASERSAEAAETSAKEAAEMTSIERDRRGEEVAAAAARNAPRLELEPDGGHWFRLVNTGGTAATDIALDFGTFDLGGVTWQDGITLAPGESARLWMRPPGVSALPTQIRATWTGAAQPSTLPVPPR